MTPLDMYNGLSKVYCIKTQVRKNPLVYKGLKTFTDHGHRPIAIFSCTPKWDSP